MRHTFIALDLERDIWFMNSYHEAHEFHLDDSVIEHYSEMYYINLPIRINNQNNDYNKKKTSPANFDQGEIFLFPSPTWFPLRNY